MENGTESPAFADSEQAKRIIGLLMHQYNAVSQAIADVCFDPLLLELTQEDGREFFDAEGWCEGFMLGVSIFLDAWRPVLEKHTELIAPMLLLGTEKGWKILHERAQDAEAGKSLTRETYEAIPGAVSALSSTSSRSVSRTRANAGQAIAAQPLRRGAAKVGRNELCPCGSGTKFKKCCGLSEGLH